MGYVLENAVNRMNDITFEAFVNLSPETQMALHNVASEVKDIAPRVSSYGALIIAASIAEDVEKLLEVRELYGYDRMKRTTPTTGLAAALSILSRKEESGDAYSVIVAAWAESLRRARIMAGAGHWNIMPGDIVEGVFYGEDLADVVE